MANKRGNMETIRYLTIEQFSKKYPWPTNAALRALVYDAKINKNNFQKAFVRVGRRVLIDVEEFWKCVDKHRIKK